MSTMKGAVTGERVVQKKKQKNQKKAQRGHVHHERAVTRKKNLGARKKDKEARETMSTMKVAVTGERVVQKKTEKSEKKTKGPCPP